jgi:hypothetical protein
MAKSCADVRCAFRVLWATIALIVAMMVAIVSVMTMGTGESAEVTGRVTSFGFDYATSSGLPRAVVSVELESGATIDVEGKRGILIGIGDEVVLLRDSSLSASDAGYRFLRVKP